MYASSIPRAMEASSHCRRIAWENAARQAPMAAKRYHCDRSPICKKRPSRTAARDGPCRTNQSSILLFGHHAAIVGIDQQVHVLALRVLGVGFPQALVELHVADVLVALRRQLGLDLVFVELGRCVGFIDLAGGGADLDVRPLVVAAARLGLPHAVLEFEAFHLLIAGVGDVGLDGGFIQRAGRAAGGVRRGGRRWWLRRRVLRQGGATRTQQDRGERCGQYVLLHGDTSSGKSSPAWARGIQRCVNAGGAAQATFTLTAPVTLRDSFMFPQ